MRTGRRDVFAVSLAACGFGCISVLAKMAYEAGSAPASLLTARLLVAAAALVPLLLPRVLAGGCCPAWGAAGRGAAGGLCFAAAGFMEFEGLSRLPAAALVVILFLAPVWVAVGSRLLWGRRLEPRSAAWLGLVAAGMLLLVGAPGRGDVDPAGAALAMAASVLYAGVFILLEDLVGRVGPIMSIGLVMWSGALAANLLGPAGAAELSEGATAWYAVAVGLLTAGSLLLLAGGMRTTPAFAAAVVTAAEPVAAAVLAWVVLGELLSAIQVMGGLVAVAGVVAIARG